MSIERENSMEVDLPVSHSHGQGNTNLKRSNSAPMINVLVNTTQSPPEIRLLVIFGIHICNFL